jgi:OOP family OmpA-OmpF porin
MKTKSFILIALLVAAFSFPAEAQVKVKVNVKGLLNAATKEAEKAANKKKEQGTEQAKEQELTSDKERTTTTEKTETTATEKPKTPKTYDKLILPLYSGSKIRDDYKIGFEELPVIINDSTVRNVEGYIRRLFCSAPEGRSQLEVRRNYENAIKESGGSILFINRNPQAIRIKGNRFKDIFLKHRTNRNAYEDMVFPNYVTEYLSGKLSTTDKDVYVIIAVGHAGSLQSTYYEIITVETEPMEIGMVTAANIGEGLSTLGRIAIYDIFFDTGQSEVKPESANALKAIAEYLNANETQNVVIVGHTDNVGDFDMNISLSQSRADAVMEKLISEYGVNREQLKPFGVGPVSPVESNSTEEGRAQNRRVEIVEQ